MTLTGTGTGTGTATGNTFSGSIPAPAVTLSGAAYYIKATDALVPRFAQKLKSLVGA